MMSFLVLSLVGLFLMVGVHHSKQLRDSCPQLWRRKNTQTRQRWGGEGRGPTSGATYEAQGITQPQTVAPVTHSQYLYQVPFGHVGVD